MKPGILGIGVFSGPITKLPTLKLNLSTEMLSKEWTECGGEINGSKRTEEGRS